MPIVAEICLVKIQTIVITHMSGWRSGLTHHPFTVALRVFESRTGYQEVVGCIRLETICRVA